LRDALHDGREARDSAASEVVAVTEAARQHDAFGTLEALVLVPQRRDILPHHVAQPVHRIEIIERAGKADDAPLHQAAPSISKWKSSMFGLARSCSHIFEAEARAASGVFASMLRVM